MKAVLAFALIFVVAVSAETNHKNAIPINKYMISSRLFNLAREPAAPRGSRIVGGQESTPDQFPYQAALYITKPDGDSFCGGSLISNTTVLTAAHCLDGSPSQIQVVLGAWNLNLDEASQVSNVVQEGWKQHEDWNSNLLINDLAIIRIPAVTFNTHISAVNLPTRSQEDTTFAGYTATISGWGRSSDSSSSIESILRYVEAPIITDIECIAYHPTTSLGAHICASG